MLRAPLSFVLALHFSFLSLMTQVSDPVVFCPSSSVPPAPPLFDCFPQTSSEPEAARASQTIVATNPSMVLSPVSSPDLFLPWTALGPPKAASAILSRKSNKKRKLSNKEKKTGDCRQSKSDRKRSVKPKLRKSKLLLTLVPVASVAPVPSVAPVMMPPSERAMISRLSSDILRCSNSVSRSDDDEEVTLVKKKERVEAIRSLRQTYESIFEQQMLVAHSDPLYWKRCFRLVGNDLLKQHSESSPSKTSATSVDSKTLKPDLVVSYQDALFHFSAPEDLQSKTSSEEAQANPLESKDNVKAILVGSWPGCDVELLFEKCAGDLGLSRLHLLIYWFPTLHKIWVVDVGSLFGVVTLKRESVGASFSSDKPRLPCLSSTPDNRCVLEFDDTEYVLLELCAPRPKVASKLVLNPPLCIACCNAPRTVTLPCGHHVTCEPCTLQLANSCPICRASFVFPAPEPVLSPHIAVLNDSALPPLLSLSRRYEAVTRPCISKSS